MYKYETENIHFGLIFSYVFDISEIPVFGLVTIFYSVNNDKFHEFQGRFWTIDTITSSY